ncbi:hypothetical protein LSAT2_019036 [Lamellibrachia satsuma]|nr:hypothetical protein LSAT2_019036 [Lamellibrachia satsuma]
MTAQGVAYYIDVNHRNGIQTGDQCSALFNHAMVAEEKLKASTRSSGTTEWVPFVKCTPLIRMRDRTNGLGVSSEPVIRKINPSIKNRRLKPTAFSARSPQTP